MEQKIIWMRYLAFGISIFTFLQGRKDRIEYSVKAEVIYINETQHTINFPTGWEKFNVLPNDTTRYIQEGDGSKNPTAESFEAPLLGCDPCIIYYDAIKW